MMDILVNQHIDFGTFTLFLFSCFSERRDLEKLFNNVFEMSLFFYVSFIFSPVP